jgi:hypothetical protein
MYARRLTFFLGAATLPVLLVACGGLGGSVDTDGDGLTDKEEEELGTDPELTDTDGDGLSDLEERDLGTDGTQYDTDGDGYSDFEENHAGTDPTDDGDVIYQGGWPYNVDKDSIDGLALTERIRVGDTMARYIGFDQHGDEVDLYDFAGHGRPILLDTSALDCGPCQGLSMWVTGAWSTTQFADWLTQGQDDTALDSWNVIQDAVEDGDMYWITLMYQSFQTGAPAGQNGVDSWAGDFPHDKIPTLTTNQEGSDTAFEGDDGVSYGQDWYTHVNLSFYPFVTLFDENLKLIKNSSQRSSWTAPMDELAAILSGEESD